MHEAALAYAALPAPSVVLGMALRPYSLGHELYLIREQNVLLNPISARKRAKFPDLEEAVLICCQGWEGNARMCGEWLIGLKVALWQRRSRRLELGPEIEAFLEYWEAGRLAFPLSGIPRPGRGGGRMAGAPFLLRVQQFLVRELRLSQAEAWDYPLGLGWMQWQAFHEGEDRLEIYNEAEAAHDRFVAEQEALEEGGRRSEDGGRKEDSQGPIADSQGAMGEGRGGDRTDRADRTDRGEHA